MTYKKTQQGFTIVELLIVLGISAVLTGVVLAKYKTFDVNAKFANASEDVVLALRQAQVYGIGVKQTSEGSFSTPYGVYFNTGADKNKITIFADIDNNNMYSLALDGGPLEVINWPNTIYVSTMTCTPTPNPTTVYVTFKRPSVDAFIKDGNGTVLTACDITISNGTKSSTITITDSGQISLQ